MGINAKPLKTDQSPATSFDVLRPLRIRVAIAWIAGVLSVALLLIERQVRVVHLLSVPFILLLIVVFGAALEVMARGFWRLLHGPRRHAALTWAIVGVIPPLFWIVLGWYGHHQLSSRNLPNNFPMALIRMAGTSLMEAHARLHYPHRLESDRIVMFHDDGLTDPQGDLAAMDQHVARMEKLTGVTRRAKIWWIRGKLLGQSNLSIRGLALGSSISPAEKIDRHELAHAFMNQGKFLGFDPPTFLMEGWAEAQSVDGKELAKRAAAERRHFAEMLPWWETIERDGLHDTVHDPQGMKRLFEKIRAEGKIDSYLRELVDPFWYCHDDGVVYSIGGAFVDFLLRRYGPERFAKLYFNVRPGTFESECQKLYGIDLQSLERQFWEDVEQQNPKPQPR